MDQLKPEWRIYVNNLSHLKGDKSQNVSVVPGSTPAPTATMDLDEGSDLVRIPPSVEVQPAATVPSGPVRSVADASSLVDQVIPSNASNSFAPPSANQSPVATRKSSRTALDKLCTQTQRVKQEKVGEYSGVIQEKIAALTGFSTQVMAADTVEATILLSILTVCALLC